MTLQWCDISVRLLTGSGHGIVDEDERGKISEGVATSEVKNIGGEMG